MNIEYIRELSAKEKYNVTSPDYDILTSPLIVSSKIDFNSSSLILKKAIYEWKRIHPFLRCSIQKESDDKFSFVIANENKIENSLMNIEFLYYENNDVNINNHLIELLTEREILLKFNLEKDLLWRLKFFKLEQTNDGFKYLILYSVQHAICEARYKYLGLIELFEIIEDIYNNKYVEKQCYNILPAVENRFQFRNDGKINFNFPKVPSFVNAKDAKHQSITDDYYYKNIDSSHLDGFIKTTKNENYISIKELIKSSIMNNSKFKFLKFDKSLIEPIIKKSKSKGVKMNGCINMILIIAHKLLYESYGVQINQINYYNSISFRQYLDKEEEKEAQKFSYLVSGLPKYYDFDIPDQCGFDYYMNNFWSMAKLESDSFHERLNQKEHYISWVWNDFKYEPSNMWYEFFCANLGSLPSSANSDYAKSLIRVNEFYELMRIDESSKDSISTSVTCSLENNLLLVMMYNSFFISKKHIESLSNTVSKILDHLALA